MSDEAFKLLILLVTGLLATLGALASLISVLRVGKVHQLVNSQYSNLLERNLVANETIARLDPSAATHTAAAASKQAVEDHRL